MGQVPGKLDCPFSIMPYNLVWLLGLWCQFQIGPGTASRLSVGGTAEPNQSPPVSTHRDRPERDSARAPVSLSIICRSRSKKFTKILLLAGAQDIPLEQDLLLQQELLVKKEHLLEQKSQSSCLRINMLIHLVLLKVCKQCNFYSLINNTLLDFEYYEPFCSSGI